jgi:polysaccharide export outer membrane protein
MKRLFIITGILYGILIASCVPYKDTLYLQNKNTALDSTQVITEVQKPYRVQINDILNIRVKSLDQDNVQIFNPIGEQKLNATNEQRAYFDGFTIDLHGDIRVPTLGKIKNNLRKLLIYLLL